MDDAGRMSPVRMDGAFRIGPYLITHHDEVEAMKQRERRASVQEITSREAEHEEHELAEAAASEKRADEESEQARLPAEEEHESLKALSVRELRDRAAEDGCTPEQIDEARMADTPKVALTGIAALTVFIEAHDSP